MDIGTSLSHNQFHLGVPPNSLRLGVVPALKKPRMALVGLWPWWLSQHGRGRHEAIISVSEALRPRIHSSALQAAERTANLSRSTKQLATDRALREQSASSPSLAR